MSVGAGVSSVGAGVHKAWIWSALLPRFQPKLLKVFHIKFTVTQWRLLSSNILQLI